MYLSAKMYKNLIMILLVAGIYACLRYVVFGEVHWPHIPTYILNKAMAVSAVFTLLISAIAFARGNKDTARDWGVMSFHLVLYHLILSLMIFSPAYYPYFFWQGTLRLAYEISMSFGAFGVYCFVMLFVSSHGTQRMRIFKILVATSAVLHITLMAYGSWFTPVKWNGYMPPISLWSGIFSAIALIIYLKYKDTPVTN